jgi:hypothetical protein
LIGAKDVKTFPAAMALIRELKQPSLLVNFLFEEIDPGQFAAHVKLNEELAKRYPAAEAIRSFDPIMPLGRSVIFNRATPLHSDRLDPVQGWAVLVALGDAKKGRLWIPRLNLKIDYEPGTIIFIRGQLLEHEVLMFDNGQCISIAFFTHTAIWEEFDIILLYL